MGILPELLHTEASSVQDEDEPGYLRPLLLPHQLQQGERGGEQLPNNTMLLDWTWIVMKGLILS